MLAARLVYEQTYLTWKHGPQMVGFALAHGSGIILVVLLLSALLLHLWVLASGLAMLWYRRRVSRGHGLRVTVAVATIGVINVPYTTWKSVVVGMVGARGHEGAFFVDAAVRGDLGLVRRLLDTGVPVDARDADGDTALKGAAVAGELEVVRFLIERGADPNNRAGILDSTPLICAAEMGHAGIVEFLLTQGADPTLNDKKGQTALMIADRNGHTQIVELLRRAEPRE